MNDEKIKWFIIKKMKAVEPVHWDLLDESGIKSIKKILEDEDQCPTKEWGPFGWYCHSTLTDIDKAWVKQYIFCILLLSEFSEVDELFKK
jgi:hypothetical protein